MNNGGKVILIMASSMLALLIMEIVVRVLDVPPRPLGPLPIPSYRLSTNPVLIYEYRPWYKPTDAPFDDAHKGYAINSAGFRDYEYEEAKPKGTYRIVVLGDSTTAGNLVQNLDRTYTKQLEMLLNENKDTGNRYEVLNMGVGGYHTMQEIETLRVKGLKYQPDLVIVTFCLNDFDLHSDGGVSDRLREANHLSVQNTESIVSTGLLRMSRLAFIIRHRLSSWNTPHDEWYFKNVLKEQSTVRAGLSLLSTLQQEYGFHAFVVILPEFRTRFSEYKSSAIHEKVFQAAEGLPGITVFDLLKSFAALDNDAAKFAFDAVHMNEYGHKAMAKILLPIVRASAGESSQKHEHR